MHAGSKIILLLLFPFGVLAQSIHPGIYSNGLMIGIDSTTGKITGVYEDASGWNEELKAPQFSCVFYIEGEVLPDSFPIVTYYSGDKETDSIGGTLVVENERNILIKLEQDHGGCWNVTSFSNEPVQFELVEAIPWLQVCYVVADKAWFYTDASSGKKQKSYVVKNDFVCVERIEGSWAFCTFYGEVITRGWLRAEDLNRE